VANITKVYLADGATLPRRASRRTDKDDKSFKIGVDVHSNPPRITALVCISFEGEARFFPSGSVGVKLTGWNSFVIMFEPDTVLWIEDSVTATRTYNYHTCTRCCKVSYQTWFNTLSNKVGFRDIGFKCPKCGNKWRFDGV
jgi:hypothetical protein